MENEDVKRELLMELPRIMSIVEETLNAFGLDKEASEILSKGLSTKEEMKQIFNLYIEKCIETN